MNQQPAYLLWYRYQGSAGEALEVIDSGRLDRLKEYIHGMVKDMTKWGWELCARDALAVTYKSFDTTIEYCITTDDMQRSDVRLLLDSRSTTVQLEPLPLLDGVE